MPRLGYNLRLEIELETALDWRTIPWTARRTEVETGARTPEFALSGRGASQPRIAELRQNDEFAIALSRLSDIENKGTVPPFTGCIRCARIYRLDIAEVLEWYGVDLAVLPADSPRCRWRVLTCWASAPPYTARYRCHWWSTPGVDLSKTTYLSRAIRRWGKLPLSLLNAVDLKHHRYAFIGSEDWSMYPILQPGALVLIDESRRKIVNSGWNNEFERPIYFLEHRAGCAVGWCTLKGAN